jgi:glycosyltransferase involved in cell wall biosynthesis
VVTDQKEGFLVKYGDHKELAAKIKRILHFSDLAKVLGKEGRKKAKQYTYEVLASQLENIYFDLRWNQKT